jgi:DNA-binding winged helix-turn-helix (wHTH) protein
MHNHYIINGIIEFHPAASTLRNLSDPEKVVVLNSPAGRCLLLLIKRIGTIVTQQEFMEIVWEKSGMLVSPNTFYQNISILRKGLKKIGLPDDPVVTIPRIGLTLASGTQIKKLTSEKLVEVSHEHAHFMDENSLAQEAHEESIHPHLRDADHQEPPTPQPVSPLPAEIVQHRPNEISVRGEVPRFALWAAGVVVMVALATGIALCVNPDNASEYFNDYRFLETANGCHIFIADKNASHDDKVSAVSLSEKFKKSCSAYPWVYVTRNSMLPRTSFIRCNKPMSEPNFCISDYFFRDKQYAD